MDHQLDIVDNVAVITLIGEHLDATNSKEFRNQIGALLADHVNVVFDLSNVQFVDSSGCGVLLSCLRELNQRRGELKLCEICKPVRALFELVRMHKVFDIRGTRDEAIAAFREKG